MTTLAALVAELQSEIPAVNSVPTTAQYTQAIKDAVFEFSRMCGLKKNALLNVVANTAVYTLPADFLTLIELDSLYDPENRIMITSTGIIPFGDGASSFEEEITVRNKVLTIYPTPAYSMNRYYEYKAAWVLTGETGSETYADLSDDEKAIVMLKAKGLATEKINNSLASSGAMKYSFGAVSVDKGTGTDVLTKNMFALHGQFVEACNRYNGAVGML
jgi:hypothetical protein